MPAYFDIIVSPHRSLAGQSQVHGHGINNAAEVVSAASNEGFLVYYLLCLHEHASGTWL